MPLELQPAMPRDARVLTKIFFSAFHPEDPFETLIYPYGATPKAMEHECKSIAKNFEDPNVIYWKIIDTDSNPDEEGGEIIGWARWKIWKAERPKEAWDVTWQVVKPDLTKAVNGVINDVDVVVEQAFFDNLQTMRRKYIRGTPCVYMSVLCTRPSQQRRGAASKLLKWGLDFADREKLPMFAQASPMILSSGAAVSFGFEVAETWSLDANKLGRHETKGSKWPLIKSLMKRMPQSGAAEAAET